MEEPELTLFQRTRIQSEVLVPIVKAFEREVGTERAHQVAHDALGQLMHGLAAGITDGRAAVEHLIDISRAGGAEDHERLPCPDDEIHVDVTRCAFADLYRSMGEERLGYMVVCSLDEEFADGLAGVELTRTGTIMQGAPRCDFRFRFRSDE